MRRIPRQWLATTALFLCGVPVLAQTAPSTPAAPPAQPAVRQDAVAVTVNGQPILETMVQRGLERVMPDKRAEARPELVNFLVDNLLIEQYLLQMQVAVDKTEVDKRIEDMKADALKQGKKLEELLKEMKLSMDELREHMMADIRWDKFATIQANDKALHELFDNNKEMFDGTMVRARHILLTPAAGDAAAAEKAQADLMGYKKLIEQQAAAGMVKLPANSDALAREKARTSLLDEAFAATASKYSSCPSKAQGGDVNWFQRAGMMVEPFARTAFAMKPFEMSDVVKTQFGYHLIMVTDKKPGREVKFEDVKDDVKEIYCERLRENLAGQVRAKSKIVVFPASKP
jgi:peptidyl-prolyl cis-trans isomerase C